MVMLYNFNEVKAFALIAFNNWKNSANKDNTNLDNFGIFVDPLESVHKEVDVVKFANKLKIDENKKKEKKFSDI